MSEKTNSKGFYGWVLLPVLCLVYSIPIGFALYGPPVIYRFMQDELGWQRGEINLGYTIIGMMIGLGAFIIPWLIDRFGPRKTLTIGAAMTAMVCICMAFIGQSYPIYLVLCFLAGLGISFGSVVPVQALVLLWFNARRALAMGIVLGGGAIGGFIYPQIISAAIVSFGNDWRIGWYVIAIACFAGALIAMLAVRNRPEDLGQYPDGISPEEEKEALAKAGHKPARTYRSPVDWSFKDTLKTRAFWSMVIGTSMIFFLWQTVVTQTPAHLSDRGFSPSDPALFLQPAFIYGLIVACSVIGRLSVSFLGELMEARFLIVIAGSCLVIGGILFWLVSKDNLWIAYLYPLLVGFGFGATYVSFPLILGNYFGSGSFHKISAIASPIGTVSQYVAPFVAGHIYDVNGNYGLALMIACSSAFIGTLIILFCKPPAPRDAAH
ncbi:MAG: MFS transporter [Dehalococcoidia bacterium]|nr:MFS transporter [Dehalococcoidia bacterium]